MKIKSISVLILIITAISSSAWSSDDLWGNDSYTALYKHAGNLPFADSHEPVVTSLSTTDTNYILEIQSPNELRHRYQLVVDELNRKFSLTN
jgi:hypothetical protein